MKSRIINVQQELYWLNAHGFIWIGEDCPYVFIKTDKFSIAVVCQDFKNVYYLVYENDVVSLTNKDQINDYSYMSVNLKECLDWCNNQKENTFFYW